MARLNEQIEIAGGGAAARHVCRCGHDLGPVTENYKRHALMREGPVQNAGPWVDPHSIGGDRFVCRQFFCPGCLTQLDVEIAQRGEPLLWDARIRMPDEPEGAKGPEGASKPEGSEG